MTMKTYYFTPCHLLFVFRVFLLLDTKVNNVSFFFLRNFNFAKQSILMTICSMWYWLPKNIVNDMQFEWINNMRTVFSIQEISLQWKYLWRSYLIKSAINAMALVCVLYLHYSICFVFVAHFHTLISFIHNHITSIFVVLLFFFLYIYATVFIYPFPFVAIWLRIWCRMRISYNAMRLI